MVGQDNSLENFTPFLADSIADRRSSSITYVKCQTLALLEFPKMLKLFTMKSVDDFSKIHLNIRKSTESPSIMPPRAVTEADFRMPEFREAMAEDYEFRDDGKIVRKDRWERGIHKIASTLNMNGRNGFEIEDVIAKVEQLRDEDGNWHTELEDVDWHYHLNREKPPAIDIKLSCGSILRNVTRLENKTFQWKGNPVTENAIAFRFRFNANDWPCPA